VTAETASDVVEDSLACVAGEVIVDVAHTSSEHDVATSVTAVSASAVLRDSPAWVAGEAVEDSLT
jgi:hypothetical protein